MVNLFILRRMRFKTTCSLISSMDMIPKSSCCLISYGHRPYHLVSPVNTLHFFSRVQNIQTDLLTCFFKDLIHSHSSPCFSSGPYTLVLTSQTSSHLPVIHILRWDTVAQYCLESSGVYSCFLPHWPQRWPLPPPLSEHRSPLQVFRGTDAHAGTRTGFPLGWSLPRCPVRPHLLTVTAGSVCRSHRVLGISFCSLLFCLLLIHSTNVH